MDYFLLKSGSLRPKEFFFAQDLSNVCNIPFSQLTQPCVKGDRLEITILYDEFLVGIDSCKHDSHGYIVWPKGSTPLTVVSLKNKLTPLWKELEKLGVFSFGKSLYEFYFVSLKDVISVISVASWSLNLSTFSLLVKALKPWDPTNALSSGHFIENCKRFAFVGEEVLKKEVRWIKNHGREKAYVKKYMGNVIEKSKEELLVKEAITEVIQLEKAGVKDTCNAQLVESPIEMPH
ncbi:hypothetical protein KIW84_061251 [Lathyrus oleraceus]|uniref:DUF4283 domain-containing protein n=1 Tax=Pisum sativum TaxID=3888 RepID=A0A9D4W583_PEA|nr:hypothetical protein KIW84_061251 [Pisum sativum]